jgi:hypothetical protein
MTSATRVKPAAGRACGYIVGMVTEVWPDRPAVVVNTAEGAVVCLATDRVARSLVALVPGDLISLVGWTSVGLDADARPALMLETRWVGLMIGQEEPDPRGWRWLLRWLGFGDGGRLRRRLRAVKEVHFG